MHQRIATWFGLAVIVCPILATSAFVLREVGGHISRTDTKMRTSVPAPRQFALTLYYLASTEENHLVYTKINLPVTERVFSYFFSRARMTVGMTVDRFLKGRFLKRVDMSVRSVVPVTMAPCILHYACEIQTNS